MTLVRPQVVLAAASPKPASRSEMSIAGLQIVNRGRVLWARKSVWFRNPPYTVGPWAHDGQLEVRIKFGEAAARAKGKRGLVPTKYGPLPPACAEIIKEVEGFRAPSALKKEEYPSKLKRTVATVSELKKEVERRVKAMK